MINGWLCAIQQAAELGVARCRAGDPSDLARAIALQLRDQVVVSRPNEHAWSHIAADALVALDRVVQSR